MVSVRKLPTLYKSSRLKDQIGSLSRTSTPHVMEYDQKTSFIVDLNGNLTELERTKRQKDILEALDKISRW
jgi:hypothetical protein